MPKHTEISKKHLYYSSLNSTFGTLYLVACDQYIHNIGYFKPTDFVQTDDNHIIKATKEQLEEYFMGERTDFDLPLSADGTEFQRNVWNALTTIPYGKTCSYKDIAKQVGNVKAVRAVGGANNKNPLSIVIPCHRVVAADGTLHGYAGGLDKKQWLLDLEQNTLRSLREKAA